MAALTLENEQTLEGGLRLGFSASRKFNLVIPRPNLHYLCCSCMARNRKTDLPTRGGNGAREVPSLSVLSLGWSNGEWRRGWPFVSCVRQAVRPWGNSLARRGGYPDSVLAVWKRNLCEVKGSWYLHCAGFKRHVQHNLKQA